MAKRWNIDMMTVVAVLHRAFEPKSPRKTDMIVGMHRVLVYVSKYSEMGLARLYTGSED